MRTSLQHGISRFGKIDVFINNAAHGLEGVFESITSEQMRQQFAVNVFGHMDVIREILPQFRKQGSDMVTFCANAFKLIKSNASRILKVLIISLLNSILPMDFIQALENELRYAFFLTHNILIFCESDVPLWVRQPVLNKFMP